MLTTPTPSIAILNKPAVKLKANRTTHIKNDSIVLKIPSEAEFRMSLVKKKLERLEKHSQRWEILKLLNGVTSPVEPNVRAHIFYHASYGNPEVDGKWKLWNQEYILTNKKHSDSKLYPEGTHAPPEDISSNYYPMLGCYSSRDTKVINTHFKQIRDAGIGVVVVFWSPHEAKDSSENIFSVLLNKARKYQLKIALHIEAYTGRSLDNLFKNIQSIMIKYTSHPAFYKLKKNGQYLPVYYVYESHLIPASEWRRLLSRGGSHSIRGTPYDGVFIALLIDSHHKYEIERSHFDGFYTYFSSNGLTYGSSWKNWKTLDQFARKNKLLFFPTVSPGYIDTNVRPWNTASTRHRSHGHYYQVAWRSAMGAKPFGVSISSFNNWQEGTQIEPVKSVVASQFTYLDYEPEGPLFYLNLTRYWVSQFTSLSTD